MFDALPSSSAGPSSKSVPLWRQQWPYVVIGVGSAIGAIVFAGLFVSSAATNSEAMMRDDTVRVLERATDSEQSHVRSIAELTRERVLDRLRPAMARAEIIANDPVVIAAMRSCNKAEITDLANEIVRESTELDLVAVFNSKGTLCAFNTMTAKGEKFPIDGIEQIFSKIFSDVIVISSCLQGTAVKPALEFQLHCDFTPALIKSVGLSVAYSVPVLDPIDKQRLGVISVRMWFKRLLEVLPETDPNTQVVFVSDSGEVFEESKNPRGGPFEIPPKKVREMLGLLGSSDLTSSLFLWKTSRSISGSSPMRHPSTTVRSMCSSTRRVRGSRNTPGRVARHLRSPAAESPS